MAIEDEIIKFKMQLLRKMPFYVDIVMRLPIIRNDSIPTARTNGRCIEYSGKFFEKMGVGQRNFVLMHEIFHVLLFHSLRQNERRPRLWNTAADMIVNDMLLKLRLSMNHAGIPFDRPVEGIFVYVRPDDTVETLYAKLLEDNKFVRDSLGKVFIRQNIWGPKNMAKVAAPDDIIILEVSEGPEEVADTKEAGGKRRAGNTEEDISREIGLSKQAILDIIRESAIKNRSDMGSYFVPREISGPVESRKIKWQVLLKDFLTDEIDEETSYATPERKYIHMDLIIPGYGSREERLEEVWAFVDSSGSIGNNEISQFLTQLYRIAKEFKCTFNICYWDTEVTDVYNKITDEKEIFNSLPKHSGGTDINCVYRWMGENKVKPDVMLILTDGYFGTLESRFFSNSLSRKTILVISGNIVVNENMKKIGKITRLD